MIKKKRSYENTICNWIHSKMVLGDPTTCVYQFIFDIIDINDTKINPYVIMHGLGLCIKFNNILAHILYEWWFIHNTAVPIAIKKHTYFISLNKYITVFAW